VVGCTLRETGGDGRSTVTAMVHSDEALLSMHAGAAMGARLPLAPLPKPPPKLDEVRCGQMREP
jgi:hypothetical protein